MSDSMYAPNEPSKALESTYPLAASGCVKASLSWNVIMRWILSVA